MCFTYCVTALVVPLHYKTFYTFEKETKKNVKFGTLFGFTGDGDSGGLSDFEGYFRQVW